MLLVSVLARVIRVGRLSVIDAAGRRHIFEGAPGPVAGVRLRDPVLHWKLLLRPRLFVGEAFMAGSLTIEEGTLYDFLDVLAVNDMALPNGPLFQLAHAAARGLRWLYQYNPIVRSRRNVAHHYDLSDELYACFLDRDRQYSCAYFCTRDDDIDTAQLNKRRHLAAKLVLRPGDKVLDIGSGWGGLALYLAQECGVEVTGLTLSEEQHKVATQRAADAGLADRVRFYLRDYREEKGCYNRIVSVGMFEHVGVNQYRTFFRKLDELLAPDGVALLHSIGRMDGPGATNPWLRKYIFPGGYSPALSEVVPHAERRRLWITDIEILRLHYAETLRAWRRRFMANREHIRELYDERFCRMWEMYLVGAELAFRRGGHFVMQLQMAKAVDIVPLTRDYITDWERAVRGDVGPASLAAK
jgi:cyclopropane-fatty-acyl-phospholipid synthase